ncbi:hypothetical protein [Vibrio hippocampi]|uniref:Cytochrome oxidase n=1 Tax=Vibrio hippocampi TaxID=654686 RepID=A0ABM8ZLB5_9VIBR|nr:hypothetical protein [Vibrio hippocampi]CAH0528944.1 hypothetical protein VHP8226_02971 [Vibrio hippocampi]
MKDLAHTSVSPVGVNHSPWRGRLVLIALVLFFALPFLAAKTILSQHWYQSGVTNNGELLEPRLTFEQLNLDNPLQGQQWQLGFVLPVSCEQSCQHRLYLLGQTHTALGQYQSRVTPVVYVLPNQVLPELPSSFAVVEINRQFLQSVPSQGYLIADTLGQLVMFFPPVVESQQVSQSKGLLFDLRKLLKLSRVG